MKRKPSSNKGIVPHPTKKINSVIPVKQTKPIIRIFDVVIPVPRFTICPNSPPSVEIIEEIKVSRPGCASKSQLSSHRFRVHGLRVWPDVRSDKTHVSSRFFQDYCPPRRFDPAKVDHFKNLGLTTPQSIPDMKPFYYVSKKHPCRCKEEDWRGPGRKRHDMSCVTSFDISQPALFKFMSSIIRNLICDPEEAFFQTESKICVLFSQSLKKSIFESEPQYPEDWDAVFQRPPEKWNSRQLVLRTLAEKKRKAEAYRLEKLKKRARYILDPLKPDSDKIRMFKKFFPLLDGEVQIIIDNDLSVSPTLPHVENGHSIELLTKCITKNKGPIVVKSKETLTNGRAALSERTLSGKVPLR